MKKYYLGLALLCAVLFVINMGCVGCTNIEPGHVGVQVNKCSGGGVDKTPLQVGYHAYGVCTDIVEYPVFQQTMVLAKAGREGAHGNGLDDFISVTSSEGLPIQVDVSLSYTLDGGKVPAIYEKYRKDLPTIQMTYIRQSIREALQETFSKYTAQQLYSDKREIARAEVQGQMTKKLGADGFNVTQFTLNETRVPEAVTSAINAKVAMSQDAQKAEQEVRKIKAQGDQAVAKAEGEAKAMRLRADAEAYFNQTVAKSITPEYVKWVTAKTWDGKLPQVTGAATPLIDMNGHVGK